MHRFSFFLLSSFHFSFIFLSFFLFVIMKLDIMTFGTHPEYRHKGIATALMEVNIFFKKLLCFFTFLSHSLTNPSHSIFLMKSEVSIVLFHFMSKKEMREHSNFTRKRDLTSLKWFTDTTVGTKKREQNIHQMAYLCVKIYRRGMLSSFLNHCLAINQKRICERL